MFEIKKEKYPERYYPRYNGVNFTDEKEKRIVSFGNRSEAKKFISEFKLKVGVRK